ncbi:MAG: HAD family hydrolase [Ruminococcaceae bacterium]|nr:HAD family hydrolase [Oscillospiraceae bacterium]
MVKAVIFDMFETLITHFEAPLYMGRQIAEDAGINEPKFREIWDTTEVGRSLGQLTFEEVIEHILKVNDLYSIPLYKHIVEKRYASKSDCFNHLHPEIIPMLSSLKDTGIKIGLITNCYIEEKKAIEESVLYKYFDSVCMSCVLGIKKPDIKIFNQCLADLCVCADECIYVGDGGSLELETALSIGMHPVQAVWYLKNNVGQPEKKKDGFVHAHTPMVIPQLLLEYNLQK